MVIKKRITPYLVSEHESIRAALAKIDSNASGIVFCTDESGLLLGVLTDGDLRRWLMMTPVPNLDLSLAEIINRKFVSAQIDETAERIASLLDRGIRVLPLVDRQGRCIGLAERHKTEMEIGTRRIGMGYPAFIIAEIGNNHNGSMEAAKRLVDEAIGAGADCAKFQMRDLSVLYANQGNPNDSAEDLGSQYTLDLLNRFQLSREDLFRIFDYCDHQGILPLCTPWDISSLESLERYGMPAYKTASADLTNHDLLTQAAKLGKPLICSTGMSTDAEIRETVNLLRSRGAEFALLHCNSTYPAPFKDINLRYMDKLREIGECAVGYSSHDRGISIAVAAVSLGANIVEKHITLNQSLEGNDHRVSLMPDEFRQMSEAIRQVELAIGNGTPRRVSQGEMMNRESLGKSLFINCDLQAGDVIREDMLEIHSPGRGLQPNKKPLLVGRATGRPLSRGDILFPSDLGTDVGKPRQYHFRRPFGIPVRYHDLYTLAQQSNFDLLEFHLSYKDLGLALEQVFHSSWKMDFVVHAPELFAGDHILDLCSPDADYRQRSIREIQRVVEIAAELRSYFRTTRPRIVANVGGFTQDRPLPRECRAERYDLLIQSLEDLDLSNVEIIPQTMPPFPWHFGGQRYQNLFIDPEETRQFCARTGLRLCLDVSHAKLACNYHKWSFDDYIAELGPVSAHLHIADASGVDGEGLQIGEGDIDIPGMCRRIDAHSSMTSFIPEIWQGHKDNGSGFWQALGSLEGYL